MSGSTGGASENWAERFANAAERLSGTPFQLHGRNPVFGLDCVGLVVASLDHCAIKTPAVPPYALRNSDFRFVDRLAREVGFVAVDAAIQRGDLVLVAPGPAQRHLLVASATDKFIHAHAGLRRVVRHTGQLAWPVVTHWRLDPARIQTLNTEG
uniref:NlpC/P60 family protein n=1 Tax=Parerythrobacter lutipelagi TaxID=1964208 RepID=UPI0010F923BA|nr:NlpC/P60 family protein [Parerythrobacter lutipelagi]